MKKYGLLASLFAIMVFSQVCYGYDCLTDAKKDQLWEKVYKQLITNPRLVFSDQIKGIPEYPAFVTSTETHHYQLATLLPETSPGLHIGFGTTINFNIIGARRSGKNASDSKVESKLDEVGDLSGSSSRVVVFADQSPEALMAMFSFWRVNFIISESPQEWLANVAGLSIHPQATIEEIFEFLSLTRELKPIPNNLNTKVKRSDQLPAEFGVKLFQSVQGGVISQEDAEFTRALIEESFYGCYFEKETGQIKHRPSVFKNAIGSFEIEYLLQDLYDLSFRLNTLTKEKLLPLKTQTKQEQLAGLAELSRLKKQAVLGHANVSFLTNLGRYQAVRSIFLHAEDFYAKTTVQNPKFWEVMSKVSSDHGVPLTDVYLSCIPEMVRIEDKQFDQSFVGNLSKLFKNRVYIYETSCDDRLEPDTTDKQFMIWNIDSK